MKAAHRRLTMIVFLLSGVAVAASLAVVAFERNLMFFYTPSQIAAGEAPAGAEFRVGGIVVPDSIRRTPGSLTVVFKITDGTEAVSVTYTGLLPDLFREGKGIVVRGRITTGSTIVASEVLAKHDENYMPPDLQANS